MAQTRQQEIAAALAKGCEIERLENALRAIADVLGESQAGAPTKGERIDLALEIARAALAPPAGETEAPR